MEAELNGAQEQRFKSDGERRIAYFLDSQLIRYQYEHPVLALSCDNKPRIVYPDFHLPELKTYIEYYGLAGHPEYDLGIKKKEAMYKRSGIDVIPVYPWMFGEDWQGYLMNELDAIGRQRYRQLKSRPYWSQRKSSSYGRRVPVSSGYRSRSGRRY